MAVKPPPRQELTSSNLQYAGVFPLTWIKWFDSIRNSVNAGNLGSISIPAITSSITLGVSDSTVLCDATGGAFTVTLPSVSTFVGFKYNIKKIDTSGNDVTVDGDGVNIDGTATKLLSGPGFPSMTVHSDGTQWWII